MNCFVHRERTAIGVCLACGRAVCADCVNESSDAVFCKNRCEPGAARVMITRDWSIRQAFAEQMKERETRKATYILGALLALGGLVAIVALSLQTQTRRVTGGTIAACIMSLIGVLTWLAARYGPKPKTLRACPKCGYNLTGAVTAGCPECGWKLNELLEGSTDPK